MAPQANTIGQQVAVCDRRHLPFFQIHLRALRTIREHAAGPRRLRAIGLYGLLCQLANEQRHVGDHQRVQAGYDTLCDRARIGRSTVKTLLDTLADAGVIRIQRTSDCGTGAVTTLLRLPLQEPPWTAMTVVMAERLADARESHLLRDLGAVISLLELCAEQRGDRGGLAAEVVRADLAERAGLSVDALDRCNHALEAAGVLQIERRRHGPGGRHLPSVYTIVEPAVEVAANQDWGSRIPGLGWPQTRTGVAVNQDSRSQDAATVGPETRPSNARAGSPEVEEQLENLTPQTPRPRPVGTAAGGQGEPGSSAEWLCERLCATWEPVLGDGPRLAFGRARQAWVDAASSLLDRHPADRLEQALGYAPYDTVLSSRAISMPGFAAVADDLIVRAHARRLQQTDNRRTGGPGSAGWSDARVALERAIRRHGRDNPHAARTELIAHNPLFTAFLEQVRWTELCEQELRYVERRYAEIWAGIQPDHVTIQQEERA